MNREMVVDLRLTNREGIIEDKEILVDHFPNYVAKVNEPEGYLKVEVLGPTRWKPPVVIERSCHPKSLITMLFDWMFGEAK